MADAPAGWQFWIDRGGTFTDVVARARRTARSVPQAALGESGTVRGRGAPGHPRRCSGWSPAQPIAGRPRSTRSRWARRSRPTLCSSARASRRCSRSPGASATRCGSAIRTARDIFARHIVLPELLYDAVVEIDERVRRRRRGAAPARPRPRPSRPRRRPSPRASARSRSCSCTATATTPTRRRWPSSRARSASPRSRSSPRGQPADEAGRPRRHDRGRRLSVADPAPLRRSGGGRARRRPADVHAVERRPGRCAAVPGQGRDPVGAGRWHRRRGPGRRARGLREDHHLRHGRHLDRRRPLRRRVRADLRVRGRGRAPAGADDGDPHGRRRRRLDPAVRRRPLPGRARSPPAPIRGRPATARAGR